MLQGMARGKVGDVVFSRLNGEQIARVRNRNPKNPRTNAQLYQRAIMATVMQAYSAGKVIFDHSFEGYAVGEQNQRRFMRLNAKYLRSVLASDLAALAADPDAETSQYGFNAPGTIYPTMNGIQVSEGTYPSIDFTPSYGMPNPLENETVAQYAQRIGLVAGDLYTIVGFGWKRTSDVVFTVGTSDEPGSKQLRTHFGYLRLQVKDGLNAIDTVVTEATKISVFFNITGSENMVPNLDAEIIQVRDYDAFVAQFNGDLYCAAIIRSRLDRDLRSTAFMTYCFVNDDSYEWYGITAKYLLEAWKQGAEKVGDSDLILEGGNV